MRRLYIMKPFHKDKRFWFILVTSLIAISLYLFWDSSFLIRSVATVCFLFIFYIGDRVYNIKFTNYHYILFILLVTAGVLASPLYFIWPSYDKIQHFIMPIFMSFLTFHMVNKLKLDMKWKIWFTFFTVVAILGMFEIVEYILDYIFDFKLQGVFLRDETGLNKFTIIQEPIDDTMIDLCFGVLGSFIYLVYSSIKRKN